MTLGPMHAASWDSDPKHVAFVLARYHFVARMLQGHKRVLEIGCGDGTGAQIVKRTVVSLCGIDINDKLLRKELSWYKHDILEAPFPFGWSWTAVYALDVLEHIDPQKEEIFFTNILSELDPNGVLILGVPSLESQPYASSESRKYHVNCKTEDALRESCLKWFNNVFIFGMNDTTIHTGFGPMCHYRLAVCTGKR